MHHEKVFVIGHDFPSIYGPWNLMMVGILSRYACHEDSHAMGGCDPWEGEYREWMHTMAEREREPMSMGRLRGLGSARSLGCFKRRVNVTDFVASTEI